MFKAGFGWITTVAPILVAAPLYFSGKVSFGGLMMAAAAFTQVESALRWFVDNFSIIADWRAALLRVASFRQAGIPHADRPGARSEWNVGVSKCRSRWSPDPTKKNEVETKSDTQFTSYNRIKYKK